MAIMLPSELASIFGAVTGMQWPKADEDDLRTAGDDYQAIADDIPQLKQYIVELVNICLQRFEGEAADAFVTSMRELIGQTGGTDYLGTSVDVATDLAKAAHDTANEVEYTKWMVIAQLVLLVAEILYDIFWAPFTFGESLLNISWQWALVREAIQLLFKWLLKSIAMHTFASVAESLLLDAAIQGIQMLEGHRKEWDTKSTLQALEFGAIGGVLSGPLELVGMGLGKLLGGLIGKSPGKILGHGLADVMTGAGTTVKNVADGAVKDVVKTTVKDTVQNTVKDTATKWLDDKAAGAFARDLGGVMGAALPQIRQGFKKYGRGTIAEAFADRIAKIFETHLGSLIGADTARELGREFGTAFARDWRHDEGLGAELRDLLGKAPLGDTGVKSLTDTLPELAGQMHEGSRLFQIGQAVGEQLIKEGVQNNLSEGFYNLIFTDDHRFSSTWQTFASGVAMGALGRIGHHFASPISAKYAAWVQNWQHAPIHEGDSKYFGPLHPLTLMSLASNLAGHPAPFPVPRLGPRADGPATSSTGTGGAPAHHGEETEPLLGSGRRTESDTVSLDGRRASTSSDDTAYGAVGAPEPVRTHSEETPAPATETADAPSGEPPRPSGPVRAQSGDDSAQPVRGPADVTSGPVVPRPPATPGHGPDGPAGDTPVHTHGDGPLAPVPGPSPAPPGHHETPSYPHRVDLPGGGTWFPAAHSTATHATAAHAVPGADGRRLVVGHGTPGRMEIGGRLVGPDEALLHLGGGEDSLVFATCYAATPGENGVSLAMAAHAGTGKEALGPTHEAIVTTGGDVITGRFGVDEHGRQVVVPEGDWVLFRDGKAHGLGTTSLKEAYRRLGAEEKPGGPAPAEPVAFPHGITDAQRKGLAKYGYAPVDSEVANATRPDSFYTSLRNVASQELTTFYGGTPPTDAQVRRTLHDALRKDLASPDPHYERYRDGQDPQQLLADLLNPAVWTPQLRTLLPHLAADVFHLDLAVAGAHGNPRVVGQVFGPRRTSHADGSPFVLIRMGIEHFVPTRRTGDAGAVPVPRAEQIHGPGRTGGTGPGPWTRPLTRAEKDLVEQWGEDWMQHPRVEYRMQVDSTLAHVQKVTEHLGDRLGEQDGRLRDLIERALHGDDTAVDYLEYLELVAAHHEDGTSGPGPLNEAEHVERVRDAALRKNTTVSDRDALIAARAHAYHELHEQLGEITPADHAISLSGIRYRVGSDYHTALSQVDAAGHAAYDKAVDEARHEPPPKVADDTPAEARQAAEARHAAQADARLRAATAPGGPADQAARRAREEEMRRQVDSVYTEEQFDRLRWAMLHRGHAHEIARAERAGAAAAHEARRVINDLIRDPSRTVAEWTLRDEASRHERLAADPPRQLPPGFGEQQAPGGPRRYPLGYRGRVMRLGDSWFGDDAAMSRLVSGRLPAGTGQDVVNAVDAAMKERLRSLGNRVVAQRLLEDDLRFRVTVDGERYDVRVALDLGDFGQAHYVPAIEAQRNPGPASQATLPGQRHHGAVESDHENIAGSRQGGNNTRKLDLGVNLSTPFGMPVPMSVNTEFSISGDSSKSWAYGSDAVSATKRLFETGGVESVFEFPDAKLTVQLTHVGERPHQPRSVPVPTRLGFPKELTPPQPPGAHSVLPAADARRGAGNPVHGITPAQLDQGDAAMRTAARRINGVMNQVMHLAESVGGIEGLRADLLGNLPHHAVDLGSGLYEGIQHWISESNLLRNYGDLTTVGTLSPAYRTADGEASVHLTVTSKMLNAQRVGADEVPLKEESQRWLNTGGTTDDSGGIGITPIKAGFGYTIGDPSAPFGLNHSFNFGFSAGARMSSTRTTGENTGAGEVRGLVYDGESVLYRLTTRMDVEVTSDMKGFVNDGTPLASRDVTTFVRVPQHESARFEALIRRETPASGSVTVPVDQDPRPSDPKALAALQKAEGVPRNPPASMAANQGIGFSAVGRLNGTEKVLPEIETILRQLEYSRTWAPDWSPMELKFLRRQLLPKFSKEALINGASALFQPGGVRDRLYRPVDNGTEVITIQVKAIRAAQPSGSGRLDRAKLELMPAGFAGASGTDALSTTLSGSANVSFTAGVARRGGDKLAQFSVAAEGSAGAGKSASTSVGASGFQLQAMLYHGPARTFDYRIDEYEVTVSIEHVSSPTIIGDWAKFAKRRLAAMGNTPDPAMGGAVRDQTVPGGEATMVGHIRSDQNNDYKVRFVVPEELAPLNAPNNPGAGALTRPYRYEVPPPTSGNLATGGKPIVHLPALPPEIQQRHRPLNGDDIVMETIGSHHVEAEVRTLLEQVGIGGHRTGDITWTTTGTEMLTGANVRGPSPVTAGLVKQGRIKDSDTVVRIEGYPLGSRRTDQALQTLRMDVAEGGSSVSGSHGSAKDSAYKASIGLGTVAGSGGEQKVFPGVSRSGDIPGIPRTRETHTTGLSPASGRLVQIQDHYREHVGDMAYVITVVRQKGNMLGSDTPKVAASVIHIADGIHYLRSDTPHVDPLAPAVKRADAPAPGGKPTVIRPRHAAGVQIQGAPRERPSDKYVHQFPATREDQRKINNGEPGRTLPVDGLVPHGAASERLLKPAQGPVTEVTGQGNPLLDGVRGLLQEHAPGALKAYWEIVGEGAAHQPLPTKLSTLLNVGSAEALIDTMLGPGLMLRTTRSGFLHNERVSLLLKARRDPKGKGYYFVQPMPNANVARYHFRQNREEHSEGRPRGFEWSVSAKVGESPPNAGRTDSTAATPGAAMSRGSSSGRSLGKIDASRNTLFVGGGADRYAGELQIDITVVRTPNPSRALNTMLFTLPDKVSMATHDKLDMTRVDGHRSIEFTERVLIPPPLLKEDIQPYVPAAGHVAVEELPARTTVADLGGQVLPVTKEQLLDRSVFTLGFDQEKLQVLHGELLKRLGKSPDNPEFDAATGRMVSHGTGAAREAMAALTSPAMMTNELELMLTDHGLVSPPLVREGGPFTDTHAKVTIKTTLFDARIGNFFDGSLESNTYHFNESNENRSHEDGWSLSAGFGYTGITGSLDKQPPGSSAAQKPTGNVGVGVRQSTSRSSFVVHKEMPRTVSRGRTEPWLRVKADALLTITVEARNQRGRLDFAGGTTEMVFRVRNGVELAFSPELALRMFDVPALHANGIPTASGVFVPAKNFPGVADDGLRQLQAAFSFPHVEGVTVVHVHGDPNTPGNFVVGNRSLTPQQFHTEVLAARRLQPGEYLVIVGQNINTPIGGGPSAAQIIQQANPGVHVIGPDAAVLTTPDGAVLTGDFAYDQLRPRANSWAGNWVLTPADGEPLRQLGPDLLEALLNLDPSLGVVPPKGILPPPEPTTWSDDPGPSGGAPGPSGTSGPSRPRRGHHGTSVLLPHFHWPDPGNPSSSGRR